MNQQNIFKSLLSHDNSIRNQAEDLLRKLQEVPFNEGVAVFLGGLNSTELNEANMAVLMLKKTYIDSEAVYTSQSDENKKELKKLLYMLVNFDKDAKFLNRVGDSLAKLYSYEDIGELLGYVVSTFNSDKPEARRFSIYIIEALSDLGILKDKTVEGSINDFCNIFKKGLCDSEAKVRASTLKATTQFLTNLTDMKIVSQFNHIYDNIIDSVIYTLKNDAQCGLSSLNSLNNLADIHAKFFKEKSKLDVLINVICHIINEQSFSEKIKVSAMEIVNTLSGTISVSVKDSSSFNNDYIPLVFNLLLNVHHVNDLGNWTESTQEDENEMEELIFPAESALETLSINLGGKHMIKHSFPLIEKYVDSSNWVENHAGFMAIAMMSEGCKDIFKENYKSLTTKVCSGIDKTNPRIRFAALTALSKLLSFLAPVLQKNHHKELIPVLLKIMCDPEQNKRVRVQATSAVVNFLKGCTELLFNEERNEGPKKKMGGVFKILKPYVPDILRALSSQFEVGLKSNYFPLQEETLAGISLLATVLDKDFSEYYPMIMPGLKQVIINIDNKNTELGQLKANAIHTISYLCSSISNNPEPFQKDLEEIAQYFIKMLSEIPDDNKLVSPILESISHLADGLKENFRPYLEQLFPKLEQFLKADIDFKLEDADVHDIVSEGKSLDNPEKGLNGTLLRIQGIGEKKISVNTFTLHNKILAVEVLNDVCRSMEKAFKPYLSKFLELSKDLTKFSYSRKIRKLSIRAFTLALKCCESDDEMRDVVNFSLSELLDLLNFHTECFFLKDIKSTLKTLTNAFELITSKNVLSQNHIEKIYDNLHKVITAVEQKKENYKKVLKEKHDADENDQENIERDMESFNEAIRRLMDVNGILLSLYKEDLISLSISKLFDTFTNIWKKSNTETKDSQEAMTSICYYNDMLEYIDYNGFLKLYPEYLNLCNASNTQDPDVYELIMDGFGFICQRLDKSTFKQIGNFIFNAIYAAVQDKEAFENEDKWMLTDHAIAALGKYCLFQCEPDATGLKLTEEFLNLLPLNNDLEESLDVVKYILVELGNDNQLLSSEAIKPHLTEAFKRIQKFRQEEEEFLDTEAFELLIINMPKLNIPIVKLD